MHKHPIRTAVIGLGTIGAVHAALCAESVNCDLIAVCDSNPQRAATIANALDAAWDVDYRRIIERQDVDAVIIAVPTHLHAPIAIEALEAGKHVAIEKPLARSLTEGRDIVSAASRNSRHAQYLENLCFSPAYRQAMTLVDAGAVGDVFYIRCCENSGGGSTMGIGVYESRDQNHRRTVDSGLEPLGAWFSDPARSGGGMIISTACHCITYVYRILNRRRPLRIYAETISRASSDPTIEDAGYLLIRFEGDVVSHIDSSAINALGTFDDRAEIYGTEGSILLNLYRSEEIRVYSQQGFPAELTASVFGKYDRATTNWSYAMPAESTSLGYASELRAFFNAIQEDCVPDVTLTDGVVTLSVIEAAYESARNGQSVALSHW